MLTLSLTYSAHATPPTFIRCALGDSRCLFEAVLGELAENQSQHTLSDQTIQRILARVAQALSQLPSQTPTDTAAYLFAVYHHPPSSTLTYGDDLTGGWDLQLTDGDSDTPPLEELESLLYGGDEEKEPVKRRNQPIADIPNGEISLTLFELDTNGNDSIRAVGVSIDWWF